MPARQIGLTTTSLLVVASMIGTGVFTTTGFLVDDLRSPVVVIAAWIVGGITALCGALCYAELTAAMPNNGAEYALLGTIYHPSLGFVAGWITLVVGFSAPIAASAIAFGAYLEKLVPWIPPWLSGLALIAVSSSIHAVRVSVGSGFQNLFTGLKVALIVVFIGGGLWAGDAALLAPAAARPAGEALLSTKFAVGLVFVAYAYSGWNAAAYVAGEVSRPHRTLPLAFLIGTGVVTTLYVGLNVVFLMAAPMQPLADAREAVAYVAAEGLFGAGAAAVVSAIIAVGLVSTVGAFVMTGPRVYEAMGTHYPAIALLSRRPGGGGPVYAIALQGVLAAVMLMTSTLRSILEYVGFVLALMAGLTVLGVPVLRARQPDLDRPYRTWGYPLTPMVFVTVMFWMASHSVVQNPWVGAVGFATIAVGFLLWLALRPRRSGPPASNVEAP